MIDWVHRNMPLGGGSDWILPVVAETWDGYLHDIKGAHITPAHVFEAFDNARGAGLLAHSGHLEEGSCGGGTGMNSFGFKAGSGSSSRLVEYGTSTYTVGVFVQSNFGRRADLTSTPERRVS